MRRLALFPPVVGAAVLAAAIVLGSRVAWMAEPGDDGLIRLSWKAVGERVEACRAPSPEELQALPAHMRPKEICDGALASFRLTVSIDSLPVAARTLRAPGTRHDRPTTVYEEFAVAPGRHRLEIRFVSEPPEGVPSSLPPLVLARDVDVAAREIVLITRTEDAELRVEPGRTRGGPS